MDFMDFCKSLIIIAALFAILSTSLSKAFETKMNLHYKFVNIIIAIINVKGN